jgi:single-stranded DNA-binding protein
MKQRTYTDNDGKNKSIIEVVANSVHFCGTKGGSAPPQAQPQQQPPTPTGMTYSTAGAEFEEILSDGDVPF